MVKTIWSLAFRVSWGTQFSETNGQFIVALGDGSGNFNTITSLFNMPAGNGSADDPLVASDFNGDGKVDFALLTSGGFDVYGNFQTAAITLFLNEGSGKFAQQKTIWLQGSGHWAMVSGDFKGDGKQDLAWTPGDQTQDRPTRSITCMETETERLAPCILTGPTLRPWHWPVEI